MPTSNSSTIMPDPPEVRYTLAGWFAAHGEQGVEAYYRGSLWLDGVEATFDGERIVLAQGLASVSLLHVVDVSITADGGLVATPG